MLIASMGCCLSLSLSWNKVIRQGLFAKIRKGTYKLESLFAESRLASV